MTVTTRALVVKSRKLTSTRWKFAIAKTTSTRITMPATIRFALTPLEGTTSGPIGCRPDPSWPGSNSSSRRTVATSLVVPPHRRTTRIEWATMSVRRVARVLGLGGTALAVGIAVSSGRAKDADERVFRALNGVADPRVDRAASAITEFGSIWASVGGALVLAA